MSADLLSSFLGMTLQATGNNNNAWGTILNGSALMPLERAIAGNISHAVAGGTLDLSANAPPNGVTQALDMLQVFTGALTANQVVKFPNISKFWAISNQTTGSFQLLLQTPTGTQINIPQGTTKFVVCDGQTSVVRLDRDTVGHFEYSAVVDPGFLQCSGQSLLKTDFPDLFSKIGTTYGSVDALHFTLPLLTDTGRFLRSVTSTLTVGTYQANQNLAHTHGGATFSGTTGSENADHTHTGSGTTGLENQSHTHGYSVGVAANVIQSQSNFPALTSLGGATTGTENQNHNHNYSFTTSGISVNHQHAFSGTTGTVPSSGGSEARPEALAVIVSIRF
jgi:microcystin-dependent protein